MNVGRQIVCFMAISYFPKFSHASFRIFLKLNLLSFIVASLFCLLIIEKQEMISCNRYCCKEVW